MIIKSNDFEDNQNLDPKFTCDGQDISPHLRWGEAPEGTKSFALSCVDPDAPGGDFIHWLMINIPATTTELPQGAALPPGAVEIANDFGKTSYGGPCPPSGVHRYVFTVYALDVEKLDNVTKENFFQKVNECVIDSAQIIGLYSRV
jgi:Raf kinase inhibitor-like YbhB/YbcL family protein